MGNRCSSFFRTYPLGAKKINVPSSDRLRFLEFSFRDGGTSIQRFNFTPESLYYNLSFQLRHKLSPSGKRNKHEQPTYAEGSYVVEAHSIEDLLYAPS